MKAASINKDTEYLSRVNLPLEKHDLMHTYHWVTESSFVDQNVFLSLENWKFKENQLQWQKHQRQLKNPNFPGIIIHAARRKKKTQTHNTFKGRDDNLSMMAEGRRKDRFL